MLKAGKWEEANDETWLLMLQAVDRQKGDWIRSEEFLNFPCKDLCTINTLWVKYSNGKFGFSIQKEIYLSVGGKADGKYNEEAWIKLAEKVGWMINNHFGKENVILDKYLGVNVIFDTSAPRGHLPFNDLQEFCLSLFSRVETCKV